MTDLPHPLCDECGGIVCGHVADRGFCTSCAREIVFHHRRPPAGIATYGPSPLREAYQAYHLGQVMREAAAEYARRQAPE